MNRNVSLSNSLHEEAFDLLVSMEGLTMEDLQEQYLAFTGEVLDDDEGTSKYSPYLSVAIQ